MSLNSTFPNFPFKLPMILDGSTGTSLMREGMPSGSSTERWVLEHPETIVKIQSEYVSAGSDAVYAPTFGANRPTLERACEDGETVDTDGINRKLAKISIESQKPKLVGGDMSPTGLFIEPFGDTPFDEVVDIYREQAKALDESGVDFFVSETNLSLAEARAAVIAIREVSDKPIFVTMTVDESGRTLSGDDLTACLLSLAELGISAFGTNCSQGPDGMLTLLEALVPYSLALGIPLIAKPNAGLPHEDEHGRRHFDLDAAGFGKYAPALLKAGIPILGGCCGTDSEYIRLLRAAADDLADSLDYSSIEHADTSSLACTNRTVESVDTSKLTPILADDSFFDKACLAESTILVSIPDESAANTFLEYAPMLSTPFAIQGTPDSIATIRRYYNGKLLITS